jgi:hypothetical protein
MKKLIFLFSLLISTLSFAQWDGNFPGNGNWQGDSVIVINGDTIVVTFPGGDGSGGDNPWGQGDWPMDSVDCDNCGGNDWDWDGDSIGWDNPWGDSGMIEDCNGEQAPENWVGDGYCDNGAWGADFNCEAFDFDGGDCEGWDEENPWDNDDWDDEWNGDWPSDSMDCGDMPWWPEDFPCDENDWDWNEDSLDWDNDNWGDAGMIEDCNGDEAPENWVGDGYCDNGAWGADFNCEAFDFDGGDCEGWDEENPWDNDDWDDEWDGEWPSDSMDCGDMPWWPEDFPCDEGDWDWNEDSLDWDDEWNGEWPSDSMDCGDMPWWPEDFPCDENDWNWDEDSLDWDNDNWGDSGMIEDCNGDEAPENWVGDGYCDNGAWGADFNCEAFDFDGGDCEGWDDENDWNWDEDTTECDFPWDGEYPGGDWQDDETSSQLFEIITSMDVAEDEIVLILEENDADITIFDVEGFEFIPTEIDGYLVYGPFNVEELYSILIEGVEDLDIDWGLLRPASMETFAQGTITSIDGNIGENFELMSMLSVDEMSAELEVYSTQYFDLAGREVTEPNNGVFIEVKHTNKGMISEKVFIKR